MNIKLEKEELVVFVASTFGSGDPPSNGVAFKTQLDLEGKWNLEKVQYAVFGLGSTLYLVVLSPINLTRTNLTTKDILILLHLVLIWTSVWRVLELLASFPWSKEMRLLEVNWLSKRKLTKKNQKNQKTNNT
jgi:hypothetical protein